MALQWIDNFGSYGLNTQMYILSGAPYNVLSGTGYPIADPVTAGDTCLQVSQSLSNYDAYDNQMFLPTPANAIGVALRFYAQGGAQRTPIQWKDNSSNPLYRVCTETNGAISIYGPGIIGGSLLATTTVPVITFSSWWHIEAMLDYVLGQITVFVEGSQVLTYSFTAAPSTLIYNLGWSPRLGEGSPSGQVAIKDLVVYDKSGTNNNAAGSIGPCTVYRLALSSDVSNGWTITGGSTVNGTIGGEPPADSTQYISAGVDPFPAPAICGISSLPTNIVGVRGIMSLQRVQKSDGGDANYQVDIVSGSSTHTGTTHSISTSFNYQWDIVELDPATGNLWSPVGVNNLHIEINRTV